MKALPRSFTWQCAVFMVLIAAFTLLGHTLFRRNSLAHTSPPTDGEVNVIRDENDIALTSEVAVHSDPQIRCVNERRRHTALLNELRALEGLPPLPKQGPIKRKNPAEDPDPIPERDEEAIADWHRRNDAEVRELRAHLLSPDCRTENPPTESLHPYDLVWTFVDDNSIPLEPEWKSQVTPPLFAQPAPSLC